MKNHLRWLLRQFYLLYFLPTQFRREVEGESKQAPRLGFMAKIWYLLKVMPGIVLLNVLTNLVIGFTCEWFGLLYHWREAWAQMAITSAALIGICLVFGVAGSMTCGVVGGVSGSISGGLVVDTVPNDSLGGLILGALSGGAISVISSVTIGATLGLMVNVTTTLKRSTATRPALTLIIGIAGGTVLGVIGIVLALTGVMAADWAVGPLISLAFWVGFFRLFSYPLNVVLSFVAYLSGVKRPYAIKRAWRLCPITWNEVIWPPLPFATELLTMLTMQDRDEGFQQIAFVAAERRLQKRVALRASEEIAIKDLQANSITHLSNVTQKLAWTTDAPAELPDVFAGSFPRFERTAQLTGQYLTLHGDHRKGEALEQALAELEGLQKSLIAARGPLAPRLLYTANEWRALLEAEQKTFAAELAVSKGIYNPFGFGNALRETNDNTFVGRQDIVRKIEDSILGTKQTPTLLLQGARRMGKTSILNQLPRMLGPDFAPVLIDCQEAAIRENPAAMLRYLSRAISKGLQPRRVRVDPLTRQSLDREPFSIFRDWLEDVERELPKTLRVLLCFDEFERLQETLDAGWGHGLLDTLRNWIQHHPQLVLMFTGSHAFEELGPAWTDRFISARRIRASFLTREDVSLLLTKPTPTFDLTYAEGALDAIIHATNGQPFLTQAVGFELVQYLNEQRRKQATPADVETAIAIALVNGSAYFHNLWTDAQKEGQAILTAIARGEQPPDYAAARASLHENDVLNNAGDFAVPMVRRWVRQR